MNELYKINLEDKINLLEDSINCNYDLTKMERKTIKELLQEQDKEIERLNNIINKAIEYIKQCKELDFVELDLLEILKGEYKE